MRVLKGVGAGVLATVTMSGFLLLFRRALGEPPPKKITRKITKSNNNALAWLAHFGFGAGMGALHALTFHDRSSVPKASLFGASVWVASYAGWVPAAGIMPMPQDDKPGRPAVMAAAHLVFGATLGLTWGVMDAAARARYLRQRALTTGTFTHGSSAAGHALGERPRGDAVLRQPANGHL